MDEKLTDPQLAEFKEAFSLFDKDGDGVISREELDSLLRSLSSGISYTEADLKEMMDAMDTDGNGTIDLSEFLTVMSSKVNDTVLEDEILEKFRELDQSGSGFVSVSELHEVLMGLGITKEEAEEIVTETEKNSEGQINYQEFLKNVL